MQHVDLRLLKNIQNTLIIIRSTSSAFNIKPARDGDKFKKKKDNFYTSDINTLRVICQYMLHLD